jgi:hypothetical protein
MTVAGTKTARPRRAPASRGGQHRPGRPLVVARATLSVPPLPPVPDVEPVVDERVEEPLARRSDLHVARRQRRRDALVGLGVLAGALGATVFVLDVLH